MVMKFLPQKRIRDGGDGRWPHFRKSNTCLLLVTCCVLLDENDDMVNDCIRKRAVPSGAQAFELSYIEIVFWGLQCT